MLFIVLFDQNDDYPATVEYVATTYEKAMEWATDNVGPEGSFYIETYETGQIDR